MPIEIDGLEVTTWIIANGPYKGTTQSMLLADGTVAYSTGGSGAHGRETWVEYDARTEGKFRCVTDAELDDLEAEYNAAFCKDSLRSITHEEWDDALNCLPPVRWHTHKGVNMFAISERTRGSITGWFAKIGDEYRVMQADIYASSDDLVAAFTQEVPA